MGEEKVLSGHLLVDIPRNTAFGRDGREEEGEVNGRLVQRQFCDTVCASSESTTVREW